MTSKNGPLDHCLNVHPWPELEIDGERCIHGPSAMRTEKGKTRHTSFMHRAAYRTHTNI
uniref:Uncharacterized protein n=1 Tax=Octopus bimaculoides TaxID=37653 RepID=A0A0L8HWE8_OCTBM